MKWIAMDFANMRRAIPIALPVVLVVAVCLTIAATGIPATDIILPALRQYDPRLANRIEIGSTKIKLLPSPSLVASDIAIGSDGKPERKLAHIGRGVFRISLWSIISGAPRIESINVHGATLYLYEEDAGPGSADAFGPAAHGGADEASAAIERINIESSAIVAVDRGGEKQMLAGNVYAKIVPHSPSGAPLLDASGTVAGYRVNVSSTEEAGRPGNAEKLPLRVQVKSEDNGPAVAIASFALVNDPAANLISAPSITGSIGGEAFEASATADLNSGKPLVAANAKFNALKFEVSNGEGPHPKARIAHAASPAEGSIRDLISDDLFSLNLRLAADRVEISDAEPQGPRIAFTPVSAQISLAGRQLAVELANAAGYGGNLSGTANIKRGEPATTDFNLRGVSLPLLLKDLHEENAARGTLELTGHLEAKDGRDLAADLSGNLALTIRDGSFDTPAMVQIANSIYSLVRPESLLDNQGQLPFSLISGRANIENGVLRADQFSFEGPKLRASGHGQANLEQQKLDFIFDPQVRVASNASNEAKAWQDAGVPVTITGSFSAPEVSIDTDRLVGGLTQPEKPQSQNPDSLAQQAIHGVMDAVRSFFNDNKN